MTTTTTCLVLALVILLSLDAEQATAWGPLFEPLKCGGRWNTRRTTVRQASSPSSSSGSNEEPQDQRLSSSSSSLPNQQQQELQSSTFYYEDVDFHQILNRPMASSLVFDKNWSVNNGAMMMMDNDWFILEDECLGEECEQECSIPEEFKTTPLEDGGEGESFDVMGYLGIKRAEPLRVKEGMDSTWE